MFKLYYVVKILVKQIFKTQTWEINSIEIKLEIGLKKSTKLFTEFQNCNAIIYKYKLCVIL